LADIYADDPNSIAQGFGPAFFVGLIKERNKPGDFIDFVS